MNYTNSINASPYMSIRETRTKLPKVERKMTVVSETVVKTMSKEEIEAVVAANETPAEKPVSIAITPETVEQAPAPAKKKSTRKKSKAVTNAPIAQ